MRPTGRPVSDSIPFHSSFVHQLEHSFGFEFREEGYDMNKQKNKRKNEPSQAEDEYEMLVCTRSEIVWN